MSKLVLFGNSVNRLTGGGDLIGEQTQGVAIQLVPVGEIPAELEIILQ